MKTSNKPVLEVKSLFFKYPHGNHVLRGVDLSIDRGEQVLVIGDTGSGKTTLVRAVTQTGIIVYGGEASGDILVNGIGVDKYTVEELSRLIHVIGQNPYMFFTEPLVRDELYGYAMRIYRDEVKANRAISKAIESMDISRLLDRYFYELSGGEARRVLVSRALISDPILLVFDEPLMWLDDIGVGDFIELLSTLRRLGKSVLILEHRFAPLMRIVDRVYVLDKGRLREVTGRLKKYTENTENTVIQEKREISRRVDENEVLVEIHNLYFNYGERSVLRNLDLTVRRGDLVLIHGSNGCGKTTLLKLIAGYLRPTRGTLRTHGSVIYIPQNIILFYTEETIGKEIRELCRVRRRSSICIEEGLKRIRELGLNPDDTPFNLSHGQMVKLATALAGMTGVDVILLDEPFSGLTYVDRLNLIKHLEQGDFTVILTTSIGDVVESGVWSGIYRLEDGRLEKIDPRGVKRDRLSLRALSRLYEELKHG